MSDRTDPVGGAGLSSLARQLAAALPCDAAAPAMPEPGSGSASTSAEVPPSMAATPPPTLPVRRMPPAAALAVADRILAAASGRPVPALAPSGVPISTAPPAVARPEPQPERGPTPVPPPAPAPASGPIEANDGHTVRRGSHVAAPGASIDLRLTDGRTVTVRVGRSVTIGRVGAAGVLGIDNPEISRRHVTVTMRPDGPVAVDEGSTNGTSVVRDGLWHDLAPGVEMVLRAGDRLVVPDDIWLAHVVVTAEGAAG